MEVIRDPIVVAALQFGTTDTGLAFSFKNEFKADELNIHSCDICQSQPTCMIPTCLLLDKEKKCVAFGYDAERQYAELVMDEQQNDYYFFDRFTMSLHNNENVTLDMVLKDKTGKQCSAVEVFTLSITSLVAHLMKMEKGLMMGDMLWVLTVPATWTNSAKQLMRESAKQAGLHAENVLLITEPEASFTYCHTLTARLHEYKGVVMIKDPGTKSMVVNLGDMVVDITVLQQNYNGKLKELFRVTADDCGAASVDDRFCKILEEIVGKNVIAEFKKKSSCDWLDLLLKVRNKIKILTMSNTKVIRIVIPLDLMEICKKLHGKDFKSLIDSSSYLNEITFFSDKLRVKRDLMIKLFTPTIDSIITLMKNTVSNKSTNGLSNILMVGKLFEYSLIQDAVKAAFPCNQIIIPKDPGLSVLKGAVLFGHRPDYFRSAKGDSLDDEEEVEGSIGK